MGCSKWKLPFILSLFNMHGPAELITKPQLPSMNSRLLCPEMNAVFTRFLLYKEQPPCSTPSRPFVALSQFTKEAFHFLSLMEAFKGCCLLPKHFQMQGSEAGWFLREALVPSSLVNCGHLTSIDQALTVVLCIFTCDSHGNGTKPWDFTHPHFPPTLNWVWQK